jgi:hypothetical protein
MSIRPLQQQQSASIYIMAETPESDLSQGQEQWTARMKTQTKPIRKTRANSHTLLNTI